MILYIIVMTLVLLWFKWDDAKPRDVPPCPYCGASNGYHFIHCPKVRP